MGIGAVAETLLAPVTPRSGCPAVQSATLVQPVPSVIGANASVRLASLIQNPDRLRRNPLGITDPGFQMPLAFRFKLRFRVCKLPCSGERTVPMLNRKGCESSARDHIRPAGR
jgi:hypothetical protein